MAVVTLSEAHQNGNGSLPHRPSEGLYVPAVSAEMQTVQKLMSEIAPTDIPVLLLGESGTGKEIAALMIHSHSAYQSGRFLKLACSTVEPEAIDTCFAELVTGAPPVCGTLFLDEIGELSSDCQRRLLHAIPDGNANHGSKTMRIISCSTRDLEADVHQGKFRSELFYRLCGVCVQLPPLRRRRDDIPALVSHFLHKYAQTFQRPEMKLSERVIQLLMEHTWPGNIRQLENVVKRIVALENEELGIVDLKVSSMLPGEARTNVQGALRSLKAASRAASRQAERELILQTLEKTHWNRKRAAEALQISYKSLLFKLKQIQVVESEKV